MRIDFHVHIKPGQEGDVKNFIEAMDNFDIDKAVVHPIEPYWSNEFVADIVQQYPKRLIGFASVVPTTEKAVEQLDDAVKNLGLKGLKLHPSMQNFVPTDPQVIAVVRKAVELKLPILFHTGPCYSGTAGRLRYNDLFYIDELAAIVPEATIIMAHADIPVCGPMLALKHPNIYLGTSATWLIYCRLIEGIGEKIIYGRYGCGAKKIIFGSDSNPQAIDLLEENLNVIRGLKISDEDKKLIFGENAERILNL